MKIYENYQENKDLIAEIQEIEEVGETLPFLLDDSTTRKDITYYCKKIKGKVMKSYCNYLKEGDVRIFKTRAVYAIGLITTSNSSKNNDDTIETEYPQDKFLMVNGKEIY
jgi:hypothetical protein